MRFGLRAALPLVGLAVVACEPYSYKLTHLG